MGHTMQPVHVIPPGRNSATELAAVNQETFSSEHSHDSASRISDPSASQLFLRGPNASNVVDLTTSSVAMANSNIASIDQEVPSSLFFSYPLCHGSAPVGRWSHTCVALGNNLVVYGGVGRAVLDDLCVLDVETMCWRQISVSSPSSKDRPEKILGHAAAAVGKRMWMFGGQEGRSFLRKLYSIDSDQWTWRRHASDSLPSARAGHAMAAVNGRIYLFGGQGKKMFNDLHVLNPETGTFHEVKAEGTPPQPRKGMSFVYDGKDSIVCFGGTRQAGIDNALSVFSISRQEWFTPPQLGPVPSARTNHSAVLLCQRQMLFFGGCNSQGVFMQDAYVLDTRTFTWHRPQQLNTPPAPRYHHSCTVVGGKVLLYGGINAKQRFDGIVVLESKFNTDISHIAQELQSLVALGLNNTNTTDRESQEGSAQGRVKAVEGHSGEPSASLDLMKLQLTDLLMKRNMEEMHAQAARKAEDTLGELGREKEAREALSKELLQAKLMAAEADEAAVLMKGRLHEAESKAAKDSATIAELRATNEKTMVLLEEAKRKLTQVRSLNNGLVKELGVISSRHAQLQDYCYGMEQRNQRQGSLKSEMVSAIVSGPHGEELSAASFSARNHSESANRGSWPQDLQPDIPSTPLVRASNTAGTSDLCKPDESPCLLLERWSESENQRAALLEETQRLREQLELVRERQSASSVKLEQLQAKPTALAGMSRPMLQELESQMEKALRSVRDLITQHKISEAQQQVSVEHNMCSVCLEMPKSVVFGCGHQCCENCSKRMSNCPFCRKEIAARIKLFDA